MRKFLLTCIAILGLTLSAQAQLPLTGAGKGAPGSAPAYSGPCDVVSLNGFWGFRSCSASYAAGGTGKAANICDVATGAVCSDVNFLTNGYFDAATAAALTQCATSCNVATLYDSSGGGHDATQATNSQRPILTFNALNTYACATFSVAANSKMATSSFSLGSTQSSFLGVASRTGSTTSLQALINTDNGTAQTRLGWFSTTNTAFWTNNTGAASVTATAADSAFHSLIGIWAGGSSNVTMYVDGSSSAGSAGTDLSPAPTNGLVLGNSSIGTARPLDGIYCEAGYKTTNVATSASALNSNAHAAYGGF